MILAMHPLITNTAPEIILGLAATLILMMGLVGLRKAILPTSLIAIGLSAYAAWRLQAEPGAPVEPLLADGLVWYARIFTLCVALLIVLVNRHVPEEDESGEFFALMLFSIAGIMLVASANNLMLLFLALEMVSIPTYILVALSRRDIRAQEATGKYFFLGSFAAAITLYGFSFLYGVGGTVQMAQSGTAITWIGQSLPTAISAGDSFALVGLLLTITGIGFKLAAFPLHFYATDVYQGAASPVTGMLGFAPKFAGFIAIVRILSLTDWQYGEAMYWLLWGMAAATMTVGNTLALMQHNVKRMLAYSSIAHSGYMLVGIVAGPGDGASPLRNGLSAVLFYMIVYGVMNLGAFAALSYFRRPGTDDPDDSAESLEDLAGSARRHPWAALALAICVFGLMGMPLTGGFLGKIYLFTAALSAADATPHRTAMIVLVVLGVLNSAVAAAYYLRIVASCYLRRPAEGIGVSSCHALRIALGLCAAIVLAVFVWPAVLYDQSRAAVVDVSAAGDPAMIVGQPGSSDARPVPAGRDGAVRSTRRGDHYDLEQPGVTRSN